MSPRVHFGAREGNRFLFVSLLPSLSSLLTSLLFLLSPLLALGCMYSVGGRADLSDSSEVFSLTAVSCLFSLPLLLRVLFVRAKNSSKGRGRGREHKSFLSSLFFTTTFVSVHIPRAVLFLLFSTASLALPSSSFFVYLFFFLSHVSCLLFFFLCIFTPHGQAWSGASLVSSSLALFLSSRFCLFFLACFFCSFCFSFISFRVIGASPA